MFNIFYSENKMHKNKKAFTLVELVVVVTILAVLWSIVFISMQEYSANSRDSVRINDLSNLETSLWVYEVNSWRFPLPSSSTWVTYSWELLWTQWFFWEEPFRILWNISKIPKDPLFDIEYNYSVLHNNTKFQLFSILERWIYSNANFLINDTYAFWLNDVVSYVIWNYASRDVLVKDDNNCTLVSAPSLNINNLPSDWKLDLLSDYNFTYASSENIPSNYLNKIDNIITPTTFKIKEVQNGCSVDNIDELNLYISKISLLYQQLVWNSLFNEVIYDFNTISFRRWAIDSLIDNWISVNSDLINEVMNPSLWHIFRDTFTWDNTTDISNNHTPDTFWNWSWPNTYWISSNRLTKTIDSTWFLWLNPVLPVNSVDRIILLDIVDFAWWDIYIYSQYKDDNNYQWFKFTPNWYTWIKRELWGPIAEFPTSSDLINNNTSIEFSIIWNNVKLSINNVDQGTFIIDSIIGNDDVTIKMPKDAIIDNFILIYK